MKPTVIARLLMLTVTWAGTAQASRAAEATLVDAKALYESAQYEQALEALDSLSTGETATLRDQQSARLYRALCLIALDRPEAAERFVEEMVVAEPTTPVAADLPPRLSSMFHQIRPRIARAVARQAYDRGRTLYQNGQMAEAGQQFNTVVTLLDDSTIGLSNDASLADLRMVAEGFLRLTRAMDSPPAAPASPQSSPQSSQAAQASPARSPTRLASPPPQQPTPSLPAGTERAVAGESSAPRNQSGPAVGFVAPVAIAQTIPPFVTGRDSGSVTRGSGELELTIAADGSVASARMTVPILPRYDALLVETAIKQWKYKPALRLGVAVPYTMRVRIVVRQ